jgi:hypothetical protein
MSRSNFIWYAVVALVAVPILTTVAGAQPLPSLPGQQKGEVEDSVDKLQHFVVRWFPLVFAIGVAAVCVLLFWIASGIGSLGQSVSTIGAGLSSQAGGLSGVAEAVRRIEAALAGLGRHLDNQEASEAINQMTAQLKELTEAVRERDPRKE